MDHWKSIEIDFSWEIDSDALFTDGLIKPFPIYLENMKMSEIGSIYIILHNVFEQSENTRGYCIQWSIYTDSLLDIDRVSWAPFAVDTCVLYSIL